MWYLIDGNNLIGHERGLSLADDASRDVLVRALCSLSRRSGKRVTVVFDGVAPRGSGRSDLGKVRVLYAGSGRTAMTADERILRMVRGDGRPAEITLVTSDQSLANRARAAGAATVRCHRFRPLLRETAAADAAGPEKPTHVDVREWAEYFGIDPDAG
jgi:predicted RNA-binding protein with PIN domain